MFKALMPAPLLKQVLKILITVTDEVKLLVDPDDIQTCVLDPAHVALVSLKLEKDGFEEYEATECELGLDLLKLKEFIGLAKDSDKVYLEHDEEKNKLVGKIGPLTRRMGLIGTDGISSPNIPELTLPAHISIATMELEKGMKASYTLSTHVTLKADMLGFELSAKGDTDDVSMWLSKEDLIEHECTKPVSSKFSEDYLTPAIKSVPKGLPVVLRLGQDYPLKMEYSIAGGLGSVVHLIAPRIETED